ncbi:MAG: DUF2946 domain-containing protein [Rhodocyclaceae bacterium]|nr:DUF2946 domain-containing protein [Rhodocyclaceae bacterium]
MTRRTRGFALWLAVFAVLLGALAPTVSQSLATPGPLAALDICVSDGTGGDPAEAPGPAGGSLLHGFCNYCLTHAGSFGLPALIGALPPVVSSGLAADALPARPAPAAAVWTPSLPRAPPLFG